MRQARLQAGSRGTGLPPKRPWEPVAEPCRQRCHHDQQWPGQLQCPARRRPPAPAEVGAAMPRRAPRRTADTQVNEKCRRGSTDARAPRAGRSSCCTCPPRKDASAPLPAGPAQHRHGGGDGALGTLCCRRSARHRLVWPIVNPGAQEAMEQALSSQPGPCPRAGGWCWAARCRRNWRRLWPPARRTEPPRGKSQAVSAPATLGPRRRRWLRRRPGQRRRPGPLDLWSPRSAILPATSRHSRRRRHGSPHKRGEWPGLTRKPDQARSR